MKDPKFNQSIAITFLFGPVTSNITDVLMPFLSYDLLTLRPHKKNLQPNLGDTQLYFHLNILYYHNHDSEQFPRTWSQVLSTPPLVTGQNLRGTRAGFLEFYPGEKTSRLPFFRAIKSSAPSFFASKKVFASLFFTLNKFAPPSFSLKKCFALKGKRSKKGGKLQFS